MSHFSELLAQYVSVSTAEAELLEAHYGLLDKWNKKLNLTAIRNLEDAVLRHYAESVWFAQRLPEAQTVVDVGSGGGFPGVPIAVLRPATAVTLVESHQRKGVFLSEVARVLRSEAIQPIIRVQSRRIEEVLGDFDILTARAVNWTDFWAVVPRLSARVALLLGRSNVDELLQQPNFEWSLPEKLPWGDNRYLLLGQRISSQLGEGST